MFVGMMTRATQAVLLLAVSGCAAPRGASPEPPKSTPAETKDQPKADPSRPAPGAEPAPASSARPVGTKLLRDVDASPKEFKIGPNDGHGLGAFSVAVDGRAVWPPQGKGCPELIRCCTELVGKDDQLALACLLAMGRDGDCKAARSTASGVALEHGLTLPSSCSQ
jgi:hypothetical protein